MRIALKELRETNCCLRIVARLDWFEKDTLEGPLRECHELISIFMKSISTAKRNLNKAL
jgi:four helix bundle protein